MRNWILVSETKQASIQYYPAPKQQPTEEGARETSRGRSRARAAGRAGPGIRSSDPEGFLLSARLSFCARSPKAVAVHRDHRGVCTSGAAGSLRNGLREARAFGLRFWVTGLSPDGSAQPHAPCAIFRARNQGLNTQNLHPKNALFSQPYHMT